MKTVRWVELDLSAYDLDEDKDYEVTACWALDTKVWEVTSVQEIGGDFVKERK